MATKPICSIPDCDKPSQCRGKCEKHYRSELKSSPDRLIIPREGTCTFKDCNRQVLAKRLCVNHYTKVKRDRTVQRRRLDTKAYREFVESAIATDSPDCIEWPTRRSGFGYAHIRIDGVGYQAHVYVCLRAHGTPPTDKPWACHGCDNPRCINWRHLRWGSPQDNSDDRIVRGRSLKGSENPIALLTEEQARAIKYDRTKSGRYWARKFGVSDATVSKIRVGENWKHI